jgi:superfamily II DNA or RNA helicase
LNGYKLAHAHIHPYVKLEILVGREQIREVKKSIAHEIQEELGRSTIPLHDVVNDLLKRIEQGHFKIRRAGELQTSQGRPRFHCKFTLCDDALMWSGSANFSGSGLDHDGNEEQIILSQDVETLRTAREFFERAMSQSRDLIAEVSECLQAWREMATPFQAYLKALDCLFKKPEQSLGPRGFVPTYFQESVIIRAVQSISKYDGSMLLVGTGLGKTVIAAETIHRLKTSVGHQRIIVLAPKNLFRSWKNQLASRQIVYDYFDISLLFRASAPDGRENEIGRLENALAECDAETIVLVDEAHKYRGALKKDASLRRQNAGMPVDQQRRNHLRDRFSEAVERKARILLLTATPFGTSRQDINSLLSLLPPVSHTTITPKAVWNIKHLPDTAAMPPVTVLGMHDVLRMASERGDSDCNGRLYIAMPNGHQLYLPKQLESHRVEYSLPLSMEFSDAFDKKVFRGKNVPFDRFDDVEDKNLTGVANTSENNAVTAWLSSPEELRRIVAYYLDLRSADQQLDSAAPLAENSTSRKRRVEEPLEWEKRRDLLQPLWIALQSYQVKDDNKFTVLVKLLQEHFEKGHKVIVFVGRHTTACYLEKHLKIFVPHISIGCTVRDGGTEAELKSATERDRIIREFAPKANPTRRSNAVTSQILICTDADGIGLNLQDANVVINYDLTRSADLLFQRVGRVIRMTDDPERSVIIYTLLPNYSAGSGDLEKELQQIINNVVERHDNSTKVVGGSILPPDNGPLVVSLACKDDVLALTKQFPMPEDSLTGASSSPDSHFAIYDQNKDRAAELPDTLLSAKYSSGVATILHLKDYRRTHDHVVVIFRWREKLQYILYDLERKQIIGEDNLEISQPILELLKCIEAEPKAHVAAKIVECAAIEATQNWLATRKPENGQPADDQDEQESLFRVCAVYLKPRPKGEIGIRDIITNSGSR